MSAEAEPEEGAPEAEEDEEEVEEVPAKSGEDVD